MIDEQDTAEFSPKRVSKRIKSVEVGYRVLLAVQSGPGSVKLSEIAKRCGLSSGAAHNYLVSLVNTGLVEQEDRGRYRLGPSAFALSLASFRQLDGYDVAREAAQILRARTEQSTAVAVWSQGGPVSIYIQPSDNTGGFEFRSGHLPLLESGAGRLFMAFLPDHHTRGLLEDELEGTPERDAVIDDLLAAARKEVLPTGTTRFPYADPIPFALSAPIWTADGRIPFVLSIVVHEQVGDAVVGRWIDELRRTAYQASVKLGPIGSNAPQSDIPDPLDRYR